jgi:hypothetical protein
MATSWRWKRTRRQRAAQASKSPQRLAESVKRYLVSRTPDSRLPHARRGDGQRDQVAMNSGDQNAKPARAHQDEQRACAADGKQFGGPGSSDTPKRYLLQLWRRSSRKSGHPSPEALLRRQRLPRRRPPIKLSQRERTKATWPPFRRGPFFWERQGAREQGSEGARERGSEGAGEQS